MMLAGKFAARQLIATFTIAGVDDAVTLLFTLSHSLRLCVPTVVVLSV